MSHPWSRSSVTAGRAVSASRGRGGHGSTTTSHLPTPAPPLALWSKWHASAVPREQPRWSPWRTRQPGSGATGGQTIKAFGGYLGRPRESQSGTEPNRTLLRAPDGQCSGRCGSRHQRLRPLGSCPRGHDRRPRPRPLRGRCLPVPDGHGGQPADDDHGARGAGRPNDPGGGIGAASGTDGLDGMPPIRTPPGDRARRPSTGPVPRPDRGSERPLRPRAGRGPGHRCRGTRARLHAD